MENDSLYGNEEEFEKSKIYNINYIYNLAHPGVVFNGELIKN